MNNNHFPATCSMALKEWHATCSALAAGRQILLLRKGGIHDAGGVFELEHSHFWLMPTWLHQNTHLLKNEDRDLLQEKPRDDKTIELSLWARVEGVWALDEADQSTAETLRHIWSDDYLALRFGYKPEHPLLCVALRVYRAMPHHIQSDGRGFGCRSWVEVDELPIEAPEAALDEARFDEYFEEVKAVLATTSHGAMR